MHNYSYQVLDPRPNADNVIKHKTLGIEVTIPDLAKQCDLGNIDPQHSGTLAGWKPLSNSDFRTDDELNRREPKTAIEAAIAYPLPGPGTTLATVRPDLDSIGAMAIFYLRQHKLNLDESITEFPDLCSRVREVAIADNFDRGAWPGKRPLPSTQDVWPDSDASGVSDTRSLAAIAAAVADHSKTIESRVEMMAEWLLLGETKTTNLTKYRIRVESDRFMLAKAIEDGTIQVTERRGIAIVESTHRSAIEIGYRVAPVVIAINPEFRFHGGEPHRKVTIAQFDERYVDLGSVFSCLSTDEDGWGGSATIGGSPQGISTELPPSTIAKAIAHHWRYCSICRDIGDVRNGRLCSLDLYGGNYSPTDCACVHMTARDGSYRQRYYLKSPNNSAVIQAGYLSHAIEQWMASGNNTEGVVYPLCASKWQPGFRINEIMCETCVDFCGNHCGLTGEAAEASDLICDDFKPGKSR